EATSLSELEELEEVNAMRE
nr:hypothetical protein [Tanacetum cinerariifolium]